MMRNFWYISFRLGVIIFLALVVCAANAQEGAAPESYNTIFFRANSAYQEDKYDAAIGDYEQLVNAGFRSANIFYNLGNAYLRSGNKGKAILYYERAFRMRPRDADVRSNLDFARTLVDGSAGAYRKQWYEKVFLFLNGFLSIDEMTYLVSFFYFAVVIFLALSVFFKSQRKLFYYFAAVFFALFVIVLPSFIGGVYGAEFQKKAVIMVKEVEVRFEPNDDATVHFKLHEGAIIQITRSQEDWHQVRRYDGKMGWLKGDIFMLI